MEIMNKYVPKEYLALKINYCKKCLNEIPDYSVADRIKRGKLRKVIKANNHEYFLDSKLGKEYLKNMHKRKQTECQLKIYETIWSCHFNDEPLPECMPHKVIRTLHIDTDKQVVMDKAFFDSLKNDDNSKYIKYKSNYFNGIYYRSAAERDIAIFYTYLGIPFKYEPSIMLAGLYKPVNPDFIIYIEELDTCFIHEHFGMKESSDYLTTTKVKYSNYTNAGLIPDLDILFTHDTGEMPFDIRYLSAKLNAAIYCKTIAFPV